MKYFIFFSLIIFVAIQLTLATKNHDSDKNAEVVGYGKTYSIIAQVKDLGQRQVTGYTLRPEETDDSPCIGASGRDLCALRAVGVNICASNNISFGTKIRVGEIECYVLDRMNSRYQNGEVDIVFDSPNDAINFGRQALQIYQIDEYVINK